MDKSTVAVRPIDHGDTRASAEFLHTHLNSTVSTDAWEGLLRPPWDNIGPNSGMQMMDGDEVVGVYAAVYAQRRGAEGPVDVCNLAAFCVLESYRSHSLRLIRAMLRQPGFVFTDLSPSGNVIAMNERLGFARLPPSTRLVVNLPAILPSRARVTDDPNDLLETLSGEDAKIYRDHRNAAAARHLLVRTPEGYAYLVWRRDRRKGLPLFATPLYAGGDPAVLRSEWRRIRAYLLGHGAPFALAERRILGFATGLGVELKAPRPRMVRGEGLESSAIDYLYSELALVSW